jgi:large subunit ribosomal protein L18
VRLSVYRSNKHIYAQVIDDTSGRTLASASTTEGKEPGGNCQAAAAVGQRVAERAIEAGIKEVTFDRGRFGYHGRVATLADAAREAGLSF